MDTKVVNRHVSDFDVYIGRGTIWGNPFSIHEFGRHECIQEYEKWLRAGYESDREFFLSELSKLKGKRLGCSCKPKECHGDILLKLIKELGV